MLQWTEGSQASGALNGWQAAALLLGLRFAPGSPFNEAEEDVDADSDSLRIAGLEERIQQARSSSALTYREVSSRGVEASDDDEAQQRRATVLARAQTMLDGAREAVQEGLDEAIRNKDYEAAEEYLEVLEKLRPLPSGIVPTNELVDYKRWLDEKSLK